MPNLALDNFDTFATYDNLGRLHEMRGNFHLAREMREKGAPNKIICSNFHVSMSRVFSYSIVDRWS